MFDVSGTIQLQSALRINKPFLTIAGQTAPGGGITAAGWNTVVDSTHDVIVRHLRFRAGDASCPRYQGDAFTVDKSTSVIIDHVSSPNTPSITSRFGSAGRTSHRRSPSTACG